MRIELPELCLVALIGASGSGKSTFAKTHFKPTEILSSDFFRGLVSDDETDQSATSAAFDSLYYIARKRLEAGRLTVIDATNVQQKARSEILRLAREQNVLAAAIVFDMPQKADFYAIPLDPGLSFAMWLREQRKSHNMSLSDFAEKMDVKYQVCQKLENPRTANPTLKTLRKIERIFGDELIAL